MRDPRISRWVAGLSVALASACGGRDKSVEGSIGPIDAAHVTSITDHVVFIDHARSEAVLLDVSGPSPPASPSIVPLVANPTKFETRRGHPDQLLVLSAGQPDDGSAPPEKPGLVTVDAHGKNQTVHYDSAFDALAQSDDGRTALLSYTGTAGTDGSGRFVAPNEVAIVDLEGGTAKPLSLRSLGATIQSVRFSPPNFNINGSARRLAVGVFASDLDILDLDHLDLREFTVPLGGLKSSGIHISQILFSDTEPKIYVRATGSNDVYVVTLSEPPAEDTTHTFAPSVTQLPAGTGPSDMALFDDEDKRRLLVTSPGSNEIVVIDSDSSNVTNFPLGAPGDKILLFKGTSPQDPTEAPRALIYKAGTNVVSFVDLTKLSEQGAKNVERLSISEAYQEPIPFDDHTVILRHTGTGLSVLDLLDRTVGIISGPNLNDAVVDDPVRKLWLKHGDRVGYLDLSEDFHPNEVRVDAPIDALVTVASAAAPKVVVTHKNGMGWATVLNAKDPAIGSAYSMRGFLLDHALQGGGR